MPVKPTLALCLLMGCSSVDDGAVELSWTFRPASAERAGDKFVGCDANQEPGSNPVSEVELDWNVNGQEGHRVWSCESSAGATGFEVPVGLAVLTVSPVCANGIAVDPASFIAPAPLERVVTGGDAVSLGAVEIILQVSSCLEQPCICHDP